MSKRVFDSYHVSDEELAGVKDALDQANISWFETEKGRWWVGSAGIWVKDEKDFSNARQTIDQFQEIWRERVIAESDSNPKQMGIRWSRVPVLILVVGIILFLLSFGFRI
ncbi:MAG: hypothetical protein KTR18_07605 [Acidiferrobacterales bacterium]|nr:hypothetical protein [Acidiferrobacterales bacterium]